MTTVVARKTANGVEFAHDTQATGENEVADRGVEKVFAVGPSVIFGFSGAVRVLNVLHHGFRPPTFRRKRDGNDPVGYIVNRLVPSLHKTLEQHKALQDFNSGAATTSMSVIVAVPGAVGYLDADFSFCGETNDEWAVGSGANFAMGAMMCGASVEDAVEVAAGLDIYTGGKIKKMEVVWQDV